MKVMTTITINDREAAKVSVEIRQARTVRDRAVFVVLATGALLLSRLLLALLLT
jgi:hypothetical protein